MYGSPEQTEGSHYTERGQFLDLDHPLPCSGSLVSIQYCFYTDEFSDDDHERHSFTLRIYRLESTVLQQIYQVERAINMEIPDHSFVCHNYIYSNEEYVDVMEGDIIGVYLPSFSCHLNVVGTDVTGFSVYKDTRIIPTQALDPNVPLSSLTEVTNTTIHLSAIISKSYYSIYITINIYVPISS